MVHPASDGYRGSFSGVKRPGREIDHSPPSSTEVKDEWFCTSTLPYAFMPWTGGTSRSTVQNTTKYDFKYKNVYFYMKLKKGIGTVSCWARVENPLVLQLQ